MSLRVVLNPFTGQLDYVSVGVTPPVTDSIDTEAGDYLITEAGDYLIPES
jgi:hypothetical protein